MTTYLVLFGIIVCIYLSNFFSGSEMAYSSCNEMRLIADREAGDKKAGAALFICRHFDDALGAILIGNNLVNIACSSLGSVAVILIAGDDAYAWAATVIITVAVIIFGETIPKISAKKGANSLAKRRAYPVRGLMFLLYPLVRLVVFLVGVITRFLPDAPEAEAGEKVEELQTIIETAENESVLDEDQSEIVQAAIDFQDVSASEAMTARVDVMAIDIEDSWEEIVRNLENSHFTRFPVYEGSIDHVIGVLHMNRFLKALTEACEGTGGPSSLRESQWENIVDIRSLLMEPCYVYKTMKLPEVLAVFRKEKQHLAIVVDEYGGTLGVISMEDVLEEVVGEIWDETDTVEDEVVKKAEDVYEIDGDMPIADFLDLMGIREDDFSGESETVGGFTVESFGRFPAEGESVEVFGLRLTVTRMEAHRVGRVLVKRMEAE
ncbi:MAG: hemolysin family protein [Lachnospiraceae bacterium]|nr:hemolysin family protein [Lachnospiraceae bacterium]